MENNWIFGDRVWRFLLTNGDTKTGQVDHIGTTWSPYGVPAILEIRVGASTKPIYVPWHSVVYYEKL